jgi:1-acyl-sn-glycerol-3-phosphate acyltransferase
MSGHRVEIGLVPLGSIGLTLFGVDLYFAQPELAVVSHLSAGQFLSATGNHRVLWDLLLTGVFGGFYIVPLYALIQTRAEPSHRSRVIAGNNILNALFMVVAALMAIGLLSAGLTIPQLLLTVALMNAAVAVFIYSLVPEFLMRFMVWVLVHVLYRIDKSGLANVPEEGPAVIVCNHVSFVDALVLMGTVRRPIRFVMYYKIFRIPVLRFIFRTAGAIPIAGAKEDRELMAQAFVKIEASLKRGELVGIFPEGGLTPDGELKTFRRGIERVLETHPVPVVPMALRGLWGSIFSRRDTFLKRARLPRRFWSRIALAAGPPVPPGIATAANLEQNVRALL